MRDEKNNTLTIRQKAAVIYQIITGTSWTDCYLIATGKSLDEIRQSKNRQQLSSAWKLSQRTQDYYNEQLTILIGKRQEAINKALEEFKKNAGENESKKSDGRKTFKAADYSDPQTRKALYNEIITKSSDDPKTQLDAAKLFEQIQRDDKQAAKDNQIQRFYMPVRCQDCAIKAAFNKFRLKTEK